MSGLKSSLVRPLFDNHAIGYAVARMEDDSVALG